MQNKFKELETVLRQAAKARQDTKQALAKIEADKKDYSADYVRDFIEPKAKQIQVNLKAAQQKAYEDTARILREMNTAAIEKHSRLDLESPAWGNALKLLDMGGGEMDGEVIKQINASFAGNVPALKALQAVYKSKGLNNGGLDSMVYDPAGAFENLQSRAYSTFTNGESLNQLAHAVSKVAKLEGAEFPQTVDEAGAMDTIRTAAGLK
jgi:hypothetical protein